MSEADRYPSISRAGLFFPRQIFPVFLLIVFDFRTFYLKLGDPVGQGGFLLEERLTAQFSASISLIILDLLGIVPCDLLVDFADAVSPIYL